MRARDARRPLDALGIYLVRAKSDVARDRVVVQVALLQYEAELAAQVASSTSVEKETNSPTVMAPSSTRREPASMNSASEVKLASWIAAS
ncbi:MAG: hypothetical protein ACRDL0_00320 [Thermoleophilaceae bacterium]